MKQILIENWSTILFGVVIPASWAIVRLTPTKKDDKVMKFIVTVLNAIVPDRKKGGGKHTK